MKWPGMRRSSAILWAVIASLMGGSGGVVADITGDDYVTMFAGAQVSVSPPKVVLRWKHDSATTAYAIYRRPVGADGSTVDDGEKWGEPIASGAAAVFPSQGNDKIYTDTGVQAGRAYEYRVRKQTTVNKQPWEFGDGYLLVGIEEPPAAAESRGKLVLLVDDRFTAPLAAELKRLEQDLAGDGWQVIAHQVKTAGQKPADIKKIITGEYEKDPRGIKAVFLFGHLPVPYSGYLKPPPDGHAENVGAWPADMYYGDMTGEWTDKAVNTGTTAMHQGKPRNIIPAHVNGPGDGKFDQSRVPGDGIVELQVGRVDLHGMPACGASEEELLRRYLNKNHAYRQREFEPRRRALNVDGFGDATAGWANFPAFCGYPQIDNKPAPAQPWISSLANPQESYLWALGCGPGGADKNLSMCTTSDFARHQMHCVFYLMFGSYNGVWDCENSIMRAPLASQPWGLAGLYTVKGKVGGVTLHEMGLGRTLGFSVRRTQSAACYMLSKHSRAIYLNMMGDPTLRLFMVAPPTKVTGAAGAGGIRLAWTASADQISPKTNAVFKGYHVYRAESAAGPFKRLTGPADGAGGFVTGTTYTDAAAPGGAACHYLVRAVQLETVPSGTFFNLSQGAFSQSPAGAGQWPRRRDHCPAPPPTTGWCRRSAAAQR